MSPKKSRYAKDLERLGFKFSEERGPVERAILNLPILPENPLVLHIFEDEGDELLIMIVIDETGGLWMTDDNVDLSEFGFEGYNAYKERIRRGH